MKAPPSHIIDSVMSGVRRTWDKEYYAGKAKERLESGDDGVDPAEARAAALRLKMAAATREEFKAADKDAAGPMGSERAFLNPRQNRIDFDDKVGRVEIVKPGQANSSHGEVTRTTYITFTLLYV
jgi:hypothetical protein